MRRGPPQSGLPLVLSPGPGWRRAGPFHLLEEPARALPRERSAARVVRKRGPPLHDRGPGRRRRLRRGRQHYPRRRQPAPDRRRRRCGPAAGGRRPGCGGVSGGVGRRGVRRGDAGHAQVHFALRPGIPLDGGAGGPRELRLLHQLPDRPRPRGDRRRRAVHRRASGRARRLPHHGRADPRAAGALSRAPGRRHRLRLRRDARLAGPRRASSRTSRSSKNPGATTAPSPAPTSPTTTRPTPTPAPAASC